MDSITLQSKNGGGDANYTSPGVSPPRMTIVCCESAELSSPVDSVSFPASIQEIRSVSTDSLSSEPECSSDEFVTDGGGNVDKKPVWSKPVNAVGVMICEVIGDAKSSSSECLQSLSPDVTANSSPKLATMIPNSSPNHVKPSMQNSMLEISGNSVYEESPASQVQKVESPFVPSAKPAPESLQFLSDGSLLPALQVTVNASSSISSTPNHVTHSVENSTNQMSGNSVSEVSHASQKSEVESPLTTSAKPATVLDSYPKGATHKELPRGGVGSQPSRANGHHHRQNSYRRPNGGLHPRAVGSYYYNYRGKPGQGTSMPHQRGGYYMGGYIHHSVQFSTPFVHSQMHLPLRPLSYHAPYPAPRIVPVPSYLPVPDRLHENIMKQIDYYFSRDNLAKDLYLRRHMDEHGWVSVDLISGFNKVSCLTKNVKLILDVMQKSNVVEVQGGKMRRRNDWMKWPLPVEPQLRGIGLQQGGVHQASLNGLSQSLPAEKT